jgi:hypothetical protein
VLAGKVPVEATQRLPGAVHYFLDGELLAGVGLGEEPKPAWRKRWTRPSFRIPAESKERATARSRRRTNPGAMAGSSTDMPWASLQVSQMETANSPWLGTVAVKSARVIHLVRRAPSAASSARISQFQPSALSARTPAPWNA